MKHWLIYTLSLGFAAYWASNLLLWFPWSYSTTLGITLMLTLAPFIWAYSTYLALKTYPQKNLIKAALLISLFFIPLAVGMDYVFFGLIRNAMEQLYHPTTFYGYGFLLFLPVVLALILKYRRVQIGYEIKKTAILRALLSGMACLGILGVVILLGISV